MILFVSGVNISANIRNDFNELSCAITYLICRLVVPNEMFIKSSSAGPQFWPIKSLQWFTSHSVLDQLA